MGLPTLASFGGYTIGAQLSIVAPAPPTNLSWVLKHVRAAFGNSTAANQFFAINVYDGGLAGTLIRQFELIAAASDIGVIDVDLDIPFTPGNAAAIQWSVAAPAGSSEELQVLFDLA